MSDTHSLTCSWTFWYCPKPKGQDKLQLSLSYEHHLVPLSFIKTAEEFISAYTFLRRITEIPFGCNLLFFKECSKPMWESWPDGGCWILKAKRANGHVDEYWENLLLACLDNTFSEKVVGVVASARSSEVIFQIWVNEGIENRDSVCALLKQLLRLDDSHPIYYKWHRLSLFDLSTMKNTIVCN